MSNPIGLVRSFLRLANQKWTADKQLEMLAAIRAHVNKNGYVVEGHGTSDAAERVFEHEPMEDKPELRAAFRKVNEQLRRILVPVAAEPPLDNKLLTKKPTNNQAHIIFVLVRDEQPVEQPVVQPKNVEPGNLYNWDIYGETDPNQLPRTFTPEELEEIMRG